MKHAVIIALAAALLGGCDSAEVRAAHRAEERLAIVKAQAVVDKDEECAAARDVAAAWLKALDKDAYETAKMEAVAACTEAGFYHRTR